MSKFITQIQALVDLADAAKAAQDVVNEALSIRESVSKSQAQLSVLSAATIEATTAVEKAKVEAAAILNAAILSADKERARCAQDCADRQRAVVATTKGVQDEHAKVLFGLEAQVSRLKSEVGSLQKQRDELDGDLSSLKSHLSEFKNRLGQL